MLIFVPQFFQQVRHGHGYQWIALVSPLMLLCRLYRQMLLLLALLAYQFFNEQANQEREMQLAVLLSSPSQSSQLRKKIGREQALR